MSQADPHVSLSEICELVVACLSDVVPDTGETDFVAGPTTPLLGPESVLDSLGLVTLIVEVEDRLNTTYGVSLTLADDRAMSRARSPFRTVESLSQYVNSLLTRDE